ncbi:uncharacterized protein PV09_02100 [Verruconis gallopava]|uniref:Uncharacterized protein n=1 Tax=Verruconis gallopava TaxID=253628 RepID=A0A0D2B7L6_9PEZI|nr:uncharacterized protein PV09_02100 [Verruconis gallopava]KIW07244.1 hypothetical protein PV09_02100 [Verruconis gallopava]
MTNALSIPHTDRDQVYQLAFIMFAGSRRLLSTKPVQVCRRCLSSKAQQAVLQPIASHKRPIASFVSAAPRTATLRCSFFTSTTLRASAPTAAEAMERIEQLYENASEEFQIAAEETEGNTVYAADDRAAAKAEVDKLEEFYKSVVEGTGYDASVREEVKRRAGQRVRELVNAMTALEEKAMEHD